MLRLYITESTTENNFIAALFGIHQFNYFAK